MYAFKRLSQVFKSADEIPFDDSSRIILMSDCHRGDGSWADDFIQNQNIYYAALTHYYNEKYTYIEIGDGDELWENDTISEIINVHSEVFGLLTKFYNEGKLYCIFGNHDMAKKNNKLVRSRFYRYYDEPQRNQISLYENIRFHEGLVLKHTLTGDKIFLVHGHQADFINDTLWRLSRFLVRNLWRRLELFGVNDLTSTAKNYEKKVRIEKILTQWVMRENQMLIAGHTHRPVFPKPGEAPYFNDGSCVHPSSISGIEIANGYIILVKWKVKTKVDGTLFVGREEIAEPRKLKDCFNARYGNKSDVGLSSILGKK
jgi:UDP-2,3-diacylglucosamine pyrophosphatase LpxH